MRVLPLISFFKIVTFLIYNLDVRGQTTFEIQNYRLKWLFFWSERSCIFVTTKIWVLKTEWQLKLRQVGHFSAFLARTRYLNILVGILQRRSSIMNNWWNIWGNQLISWQCKQKIHIFVIRYSWASSQVKIRFRFLSVRKKCLDRLVEIFFCKMSSMQDS